MRQKAAVARLEGLLPAAGDVVQTLLDQTLVVKCKECGESTEHKVPGSLSLKAALAVMDRTGVGPSKTTIHETSKPELPPHKALQALMEDLLHLPIEERLALARGILPEHDTLLLLPADPPSLKPGGSPVDDSS